MTDRESSRHEGPRQAQLLPALSRLGWTHFCKMTYLMHDYLTRPQSLTVTCIEVGKLEYYQGGIREPGMAFAR